MEINKDLLENNIDLSSLRKIKVKKKVLDHKPPNLISNTINMDISNLSRIHTDIYNMKHIRYLLTLGDKEWSKNFDSSYTKKETKTWLKHYRSLLIRILDNGEKEVKREYTLRKNNRLYCEGGIQTLEKNLRNFIQDEKIKDYDMSNAQVQILLYLTKKAKLPHEKLEYYCKNREQILSKMDKDKGKKIVNYSLFCDKPKMSKNNEIDSMIQEYLDNRDVLIHYYQDNINIDKEENKNNPKGSKMSSILCYWECVILNTVLSKFPTKSINTLLFDGFYSTLDIPIEQLNQITKEFGIKWKVKPLETVFKIPKDFNPKEKKTYAEMKEEFEKNNCLITFAGSYRCRDEIDGRWLSMTDKDMKLKYKNWRTINEEGDEIDFIDRWLKDEERKDYNRIVFKPYSLEEYNDTHEKEFNIFNGFERKNLGRIIEDEEVKFFTDFIKKTYGFEKENGEKFKRFLVRYFARILQKPHDKIQGILVLRGYEGTGKDTIKYIFGRLLGKQYVYECKGMREIITKGSWNDHLVDKIICVMNEVSGDDAYKNIEDLKHKATTIDLNVIEKFMKNQTTRDINNMIVNSNNIFCVCISPTDRRYVILITNEDLHGNIEFWNEQYRWIDNDDKMDLLYTWLLQQDIDDFDFMKERPITEAFSKLASKNIPECYLVLYKLLTKHVEEKGNTKWKIRTSFFNAITIHLSKDILEKQHVIKKETIKIKMEEIPKKYLYTKKEALNEHGSPTFWICDKPSQLISRLERLEFRYFDNTSLDLDCLIDYMEILED